MDFLMDLTSSGSSELGRDLQKNLFVFSPRSGSSKLGRTLQKNCPFFFAFWEFRAGRNPPTTTTTHYFLLIMPESSKILGPTWFKNRSWTSFLSHLEALGVSEMYSQCIFRPDWARQSSERPRNGPKINRFPLIVPEWLKRNTQYLFQMHVEQFQTLVLAWVEG